ncbi:MAG: NAD(P)H-hydrate dehydratase [Chlamydiota bacterium]
MDTSPKVYTREGVEALEKSANDSEKELMQKAGALIAKAISRKNAQNLPLLFLIGPGKNGQDGLEAALLLKEQGHDPTLFVHEKTLSWSKKGKRYQKIESFYPLSFAIEAMRSSSYFIVDALLGMGCTRPCSDLLLEIVQSVNASGNPVLSVDLPSGLNSDTGEVLSDAIQATWTICLGAYKVGLFFQKGIEKRGLLELGEIDLPLEKGTPIYRLVEKDFVKTFLPNIPKTRNKYDAGLVLGFAGSGAMMGAAALASKAALRSGAGLVRLYHGTSHLAPFPPEVMAEPWKNGLWESCLSRAKSVFIGPGIGRGEEAQDLLGKVLASWQGPLVLDADALFLLKDSWEKVPRDSILTPHEGEAKRFFHQKEQVSTFRFHETIGAFAAQRAAYVLLKGAPTVLFSPKGTPHLIDRGSPGSATAGSGDVLTGVVAALLAQGASQKACEFSYAQKAALFGAFLHAIAGELAAKEKTVYGVLASDIVEKIPKAYQSLLS